MIVSRYGRRGLTVSASTLNRRWSRSRRTSTCWSPIVRITVWWSSLWTSIWKVGSSSRNLLSPAPTFSSSALFRARTAISCTGSGKTIGGMTSRWSFVVSVSFNPVVFSLATAPISPAGSFSASERSLPRKW